MRRISRSTCFSSSLMPSRRRLHALRSSLATVRADSSLLISASMFSSAFPRGFDLLRSLSSPRRVSRTRCKPAPSQAQVPLNADSELTLYVLLFPLSTIPMCAPPTSDHTSLVNDRTLKGHGYTHHQLVACYRMSQLTLDVLPLLVANISRNIVGVAYKRVPASMMHRAFNGGVELYHIDRKTGSLRERTELVVDGLHLDGVQWDKGCLPSTLYAHIL